MKEIKNQNETDLFVSELLQRLSKKTFSIDGQTFPNALLIRDVEEVARELAKEMQISNWCNVKKVGLPKETGNYIVSMTHYGHNKLKQGEPIEKVEIRHFYASEGGLNANVWEYKNSPFENFDIHAYMPFPEFYRERDSIALEEDKDDLEM